MSRRDDEPHQPTFITPATNRALAAPSSAAPRPMAATSGARRSVDSRQGMSPQFVLRSLRHWWMVAAPVGLALAVAGAGVVWWLFEPIYLAKAWIQVRETPPALVFQVESQSKGYVETQKEMIRSARVLRPVVDSANIRNLPELSECEDRVSWLQDQIKLASVGQSEFLGVEFGGPDPENAATIVNAVVAQYFSLLAEVNDERVTRVIALLDREVTTRKGDVEQRRQAIQTKAITETGKDPFTKTLQGGATWPHPLAELQNKLTVAEVEREVLEAELKALEELPAQVGYPQVKNADEKISKALQENMEIRTLDYQILTNQTKLRQMVGVSADPSRDRRCLELSNEISRDQKQLGELKKTLEEKCRAELQKTAAAERENELARKTLEIESGRRMEQALRERYESEMKKVLPGIADMVNLEFEQAELARATDVLNRIEQRMVELRTERQAPARVALYDAALPPQAPVEAVPYARMGLAGVVGFCLPFVLVVGFERMVRRIGDAGQLEKETNLTVIGEIARLPERTRKPRAATSNRTAQKLRLYEESIDSMRTFLVLAEDLKYAKVFAVTSATGHEGKTSVAAQLALSLARASGKPTLLIDGDMREPDLHEVFEVARTPGLAEVLAGDCELESAIVPSWSPHVFLLPAGELKTSPHQLVGNGALRSVLERTSRTYGYIVLDTPPILSAAESLVLAKAADASLICAMQDVSRAGQVRNACERLVAAGCRPVAAVLNGVSPQGYGYRYGHYEHATS
ncbi:MAG: polysaccharide biosynthesis tyrosine autokinase [Planctomycetia bacterium]|nr:polysaccharide biosynthesis tyrosine autokinase [Planctomycetia bacterium]